tara:strand:+ start:856 stop:2508 length:1653 start_codon:yes stop_codon:yes gene_type:complete
MIKIDTKTSKKIIFLLFSCFFLVGLFTFRDYGISVDEEFHRSSGFYWLQYILNFTSFEVLKNLVDQKINQIHGFTLPSPKDFPFYGVVFDLPVAFIEVIFKVDDIKKAFYLKHFLNFTLFFTSSIFFYKILKNRFSSFSISFIGTLFFILSPRIYGSSFFNNKDVIFLSLITISLYYCFKSFDNLSKKNLILFSILAGLSTAQRIFGFFLPIAFLIFFVLTIQSDKEKFHNIIKIFIFLIFYFLSLYIFWPVLWTDPIGNLLGSFKFFSAHPTEIKMLFNGNFIDSNFLPYSYIFKWIYISTPILYTIFFVVGFFLISKRFSLRFINIKNNCPHNDLWRGDNEKKDLFIFFCLISIVSYLVFFNIVIYTGWRQIYFLNIFIIYISTFAFYKIEIYLKNQNRKKIYYFLTILFLIFITFKMFIYHPYQNIYFNFLFNKKADKKFEVDYWGLSGKKFLENIVVQNKDKNVIKVAVASFLPLERSLKLLDKRNSDKLQIIGQNYKDADYVFTNNVSEVDKNFNDKYKIPANFIKMDEFILDGIIVYQVFKKQD